MRLDPNTIKRIYMLGIGGIGMSALARYFHAMGVGVSGYDRTETQLTTQLQEEGIGIHFQDDPGKIPADIDLVIYTPAIPSNLKEFIHLSNTGIPIKKRAEVLGDLTHQSSTIAVSGTHGKTTVSTMIAHILYHSSLGCSAFLGGIARNYNSNFLHSPNSDLIVVEADEFDKSFLQLKPRYTVVTSMDADHLDIYSSYSNLKETFSDFISGTQKGGDILIKKGVDIQLRPALRNCYSYSLKEGADFYSRNLQIHDGIYSFDLVTPKTIIHGLSLGMPGLINVENAVVAASISLLSGASEQEIRHALATFKGIKRRFDVRVRNDNIIYIDDYAHHPEEIKGFIRSVRKLYPNKKILGIFQPHLYTRTRDFAKGFAEGLELLDEVFLLPIYPAREKPIEGVDSNIILDKIQLSDKKIVAKEKLVNSILKSDKDIILTIGAGDIDQLVEPLENSLKTMIKV